MALIKCPECGKELSSKALSCPNCGYERVKKKPRTGLVDGLCLASMILAVIASIMGGYYAVIVTIVWFFIYQIINSKYSKDPLINNKGIEKTLSTIGIVLVFQLALLFFSC